MIPNATVIQVSPITIATTEDQHDESATTTTMENAHYQDFVKKKNKNKNIKNKKIYFSEQINKEEYQKMKMEEKEEKKEEVEEKEDKEKENIFNRQLAHGTIIAIRCNEIGLYKLMGADELQCVDGLWSQQIPHCAPTTIHQNFSCKQTLLLLLLAF